MIETVRFDMKINTVCDYCGSPYQLSTWLEVTYPSSYLEMDIESAMTDSLLEKGWSLEEINDDMYCPSCRNKYYKLTKGGKYNE
jgi:Zn finger protein HypA/HybF involved in hydrogenase expression